MVLQKEENTNHLDKLREAFNAFDLDGNGLITCKEFIKAMIRLGQNISEKQVKK